MEVQYRARRSFEKPHVEAPPRLQVIGFNVSPQASYNELSFEHKTSPSLQPKPAPSPRSALQQLLLNQSPPSTSSPSPNHSPPHPSISSSSSAAQTFTAAPASSPPAPNQNLPSGLLKQQPAVPTPKAHQNLTNAVFRSSFQPQAPPSAANHQSSGRLKSLLQSECASSDFPANPSFRTSFLSTLGQSKGASSSSSSSGNPNMRGGGVAVNMQILDQHSKAPIKESYEAFFQIKQTGDDVTKSFNNGELIKELPYMAKSKESSWLSDDDNPSAEKCKKSIRNNEEKSKKSSLFMFIVSSPAAEFHHHHHHAEHNTSKNMDFLSSCHLCRRLLGQGQDVFMYSGDKAFCSMECRYQQIVIDERKERCPPPIIRSGASQVYQHTSITAATTSHHPSMINKPHFINTAAAA